jgi:membrane associated rhomboid family serine protease
MFMHGSFMHLFGNMLFLWIFGDNVEDDLGHARYTTFYILTGLLASLAHVVSTFAFGDNPFIPSLGASGAISGVMGGYLVLHPHRRVRVIMLRMLTDVPAYVAVGLWFAFQLISAFCVIGQGPQSGGGVAFMAHIGGFVAGVVLVKIFAAGAPKPAVRRRAY